MQSLRQALDSRRSQQPYPKGLTVTIIKHKIDKSELAIADPSCATKCIVSQDACKQGLQINNTVILRNYNVGRQVIFINKKTKVTTTAAQDLPQGIRKEAECLIDPPTPPRQLIKDVKSDGPLTTIVATVEQVRTNVHFMPPSPWCGVH